ncbi:hypothetical protein ACQEVB_40190 [Pseudonocardia sp. CA-107938]|uniref:hypothetical protein n=1 Tax=Pseudonocardia sp. CA-107938 TaxID=3240021 RepID=UPI003D90671F
MSVRSTIVAGASVVVMLAATVATAVPAAAEPACQDGIVCSFSEPGYQGSFEPITPRGGCRAIATGAIGWRQSAINRSEARVVFAEAITYENGTATCRGAMAPVPSGGQVPDFGFRATAVYS